MSADNVVAVVGIVGIVIFVVWLYRTLNRIDERRRCAKLKKAASELGLTFTPAVPPEILERLERFHLFNQGKKRNRCTNHLIQGERAGAAVISVDHSYLITAAQTTREYRESAVLLSEPGLDLPVFTLRPHSFLDILTRDEWRDIDFEDFPAFSNSWTLKGEDEQAIRRCFTPEVIMQFEQSAEDWKVRIESSGDELIVSRGGRVPGSNLRELIDDAIKILYAFAERARR